MQYPCRLFKTLASDYCDDNLHSDGSCVGTHLSFFYLRLVRAKKALEREVAELRRSEENLLAYREKLRSLSFQLALSLERERQRVAAELHDRIAQNLIALKMRLDLLRKIELLDEDNEIVREIVGLTGQMIEAASSLVFEVCPPALHKLGLGAALSWLIDSFQKRYGISVTFRDDKKRKKPAEEIQILVFQVVRELLNNVAQHAQAHSVNVSIRRARGKIAVTVEDDGIGFDTSEMDFRWNRGVGFGLFGAGELLCHIGGRLEIQSEPGQGSRITLLAPLKQPGTPRKKRKNS